MGPVDRSEETSLAMVGMAVGVAACAAVGDSAGAVGCVAGEAGGCVAWGAGVCLLAEQAVASMLIIAIIDNNRNSLGFISILVNRGPKVFPSRPSLAGGKKTIVTHHVSWGSAAIVLRNDPVYSIQRL